MIAAASPARFSLSFSHALSFSIRFSKHCRRQTHGFIEKREQIEMICEVRSVLLTLIRSMDAECVLGPSANWQAK